MTKTPEKILNIIFLTAVLLALTLPVYMLFDYFNSGAWSMKRSIKANLDDSEDFCNALLIEPDKGIAFINYNCTPINNITRGIKNCKGRYYINISRTDGQWKINPSTKRIIW